MKEDEKKIEGRLKKQAAVVNRMRDYNQKEWQVINGLREKFKDLMRLDRMKMDDLVKRTLRKMAEEGDARVKCKEYTVTERDGLGSEYVIIKQFKYIA